MAAFTAARFVGSSPTTAGASSRSAARAPPAWAGRYVGPRGQTSPQPASPSSVVTRTTVDSSLPITRPPDMTYSPCT